MSGHVHIKKTSPMATKSVAKSPNTRQSPAVKQLISREQLQKKATAAQNDSCELEADRVAKQVADMPDTEVNESATTRASPLVIQRVPTLRPQNDNASQETDLVSAAAQRKASSGKALSSQEREFYESRFQHDFSQVRIHTDSRAQELCARVQARAFTFGDSIWFGRGEYQPQQHAGKLLLAHELTHVVQQGRAPQIQYQTMPDAGQGSDQDLLPSQEPVNQNQVVASSEQEVQNESHADGRIVDSSQESSNAEQGEYASEQDVTIELPEQTEPEQEKIAEVGKLDLNGSSDQAMLSYMDASPSQMALAQEKLGATLDKKINEESQQTSQDTPKLVAKSSGRQDVPMVSPQIQDAKADFKPDDKKQTDNTQKLIADDHQNFTEVPDNKENKKILDQQSEGGFFSWLRNNFTSYMQRIKTRDEGLNTSAGERKKVQLEGDADVQRSQETRQQSADRLAGQRDTTTRNLIEHPGQSNIQTQAVDEEYKPEISPQASEEIKQEKDTGMADYASMPIPADVRAKADDLIQPNLTQNLGEARKQVVDAQNSRDADKQKEIDSAQSQVNEKNQQSDIDQLQLVQDKREEVAGFQRQGITDANDAVKDFEKESGKKQTGLSTDVQAKVKQSEGEAAKKLDEAEKKAQEKREDGEKRAADKKRELEREQENDSWWDRAVNAVKSAVKAVTDAIDGIFTAIREAVKGIIEAAKTLAVELINRARDWVVEKLDHFRDWAQEQVNTYLQDTFPGLARAINDGIDSVVDASIEAVNQVADTLIAGVESLANALASAIDNILRVFQTALSAAVQIAGALLTGDFAEALKIAIQAACDIAGIDSTPVFDFIDRAGSAITNILKNPGAFFMNIVNGVGGGIRKFSDNIRTHLIDGLLGWLTGALSEAEITLPDTFDFKGVLSLALQILGLTYENIKAKIIRRYPPAERVFDVVERGLDIIKRIITEGPIAIWEMVRESLSNLKEMVLSGIREFVTVTVVKEGITWLLSLLNPAAAIVKVVKLLYDFVMFLVERFQQIRDFVSSIYNTITAIAAGNVAQVITAVEEAMARSLPVLISLLASLAGLGGIGQTVKRIIGRVSRPINRVVDRLVDRAISYAQRALGRNNNRRTEDNSNEAQADQNAGSLGTVNLADLDKPPVPEQRTNQEKQLHYNRVLDILNLIAPQARTTDDFERYFPKLKTRYRLRTIEYDNAGAKKLGVKVKLNPEGYFYNFADNMLVKADDGDEAVRVNQINYTTKNITIARGGSRKADNAGSTMTAEFLSFDHPRGTNTSSSELRNVFEYLPTRGAGDGSARYIRGHLLNANLGGKAEDKNLFPITHNANDEHKRKIENEAKKMVNEEGFLVYYTVSVSGVRYGEDATHAYVNSDFVCELAAYEAMSGRLQKSDKVKKATIRSRYKVSKENAQTDVEGEVDTSNGVRVRDFDESRVMLPVDSSAAAGYLSEMSAAQLRAIPGIGQITANKLVANKSQLRSGYTFNKLKELIGRRQANALKNAGYRLYRNG